MDDDEENGRTRAKTIVVAIVKRTKMRTIGRSWRMRIAIVMFGTVSAAVEMTRQ